MMRSDALILTCIFISVFQRKRKDDEERKQIEEDELALRAAAEADTVDYASLRTLSKLGIDVSFLNEMGECLTLMLLVANTK